MNLPSWLILLLGFVSPLIAFLVVFIFFRHKPRLLLLITFVSAFLTCVAVIVIVFSSPYLNEGAQIVWTGVSATDAPLRIGGKPEESAIGWPNSAPGPRLTITPLGATAQLGVELGNGAAFVFDEGKKQFLNGRPLAVGSSTRVGDYTLRINRLDKSVGNIFKIFSHEIEVLDINGKSLAGFSLRKDRTRSLQYLIAGTPMDELSEVVTEAEREKVVSDRDKLETWAASIWLLRTDSQQVYILSQQDVSKVAVDAPADLTVRWSNLRLPVKLSARTSTDGKKQTVLEFAPPWRLSSPFPPAGIPGCSERPASKPDELLITITDRPLPCESSLVLPLNGDMAGLREVASLSAASHKFTSPTAIDNEMELNCPPGISCQRASIGNSQQTVSQGLFSYDFATVEDLPSRSGMLALLLLAWVMLGAGLLLAFPRMTLTTRGVVFGMVLVVWELLAFRLLLAFRYALDPAALDKLAIDGVGRAFFGLTLVPGVLLLIARLRCDRYEGPITTDSSSRAMGHSLVYLAALLLGAGLTFSLPSHLWSNLPEQYYASWTDLFSISGMLGGGAILFAALLFALHARFLYGPDESQVLVKLFVTPWYWIENYLNNTPEFWVKHLSRPFGKLLRYFLAGFVFLVFYIALFWISRLFLPGDKTAQEIFVPAFLLWLALLWLGLCLFFVNLKGRRPSKYEYFVLALSAIIMLAMPALLLPIGIGDFGSVIAVVAIVFPLVWLLLVTLPLKARLCIGLTVVIMFVGGLTVYQNLEGIIPFQKQIVSYLPNSVAKFVPGADKRGRMFARLLNYKRGSQALRWAVTANSIVGGEGLPYQELLNGNQHTWENKAITHMGDSWGLGFGEAPTRRSHVRQDTLQYDSVFSFFIASEFGAVGAVLLLFIYSAPLILIYVGGRRRFDSGHALAFIVTSAFLIEALYHVGMNLGAFPLTGRNLPLLSVNSPSDLLRWTLLMGLVVVAIFWRYEGRGKIRDEALSLIPASETKAAPDPAPTGKPRFRIKQKLKYILIFSVIPIFLCASVCASGWKVLADSENELTSYNYNAILRDVKWYLDYRVVEFDKDSKRLVLHPERLDDSDVRNFIQLEVTRFNARNEVERKEASAKEFITEINERLGRVHTLQEYNDALHELSLRTPPEMKRSVFVVKILTDEDEAEKDIKVEANPAFNINFSFADGLSEKTHPRVSYGNELLIGPAWVRGRHRTIFNPAAKLPWVSYLSQALQSEWKRLADEGLAERAPTMYGTLTLDPPLHDSAMQFTATKGLSLHEKKLQRAPVGDKGEATYVDKLPERVALAVLSLPKGEALALGGWPRMTSLRTWQMSAAPTQEGEKKFWIPTLDWLENEAPVGFRVRYGGDRNFDRSLVMGSSTKPLWALAVLRQFNSLDEQLLVRGSSAAESSAFGISITGKEWNLNSPSNDWVDFRTYLKQSDNRYHVRLGLLGLSQTEGNSVKAAGSSPSQDETLAGNQNPWGQYPLFAPPVRVLSQRGQLEMQPFQSEGRRDPAHNAGAITLADSNLAKALRGMFSINVTSVLIPSGSSVRELSWRRSFWTKDEHDDLNLNQSSRSSYLFDVISPQTADLAFDQLARPRDLITMLLGGGNNLWANVDLAAAFGSCLTGNPVAAHIVQNDEPVRFLDERKMLDPKLSYKLHSGLNAVAEDAGGTAFKALQKDNALEFLKKAGVKIYAKTGTLKADDQARATSRIVLALIKWRDEKNGEVETGLVFSLVAEQSNTGTAAEWLREFLIMNQVEISRLMARN